MQDHGLVYQALVYLAAGVVGVVLFKRFGLGSVLGYLAAGVVIGPAGFGLIAAPETVLHFAELGVVLLLFLVGLELNPQRLWAMRRSIFGSGSAQLMLTIGAVAAVAAAAGAPTVTAFVAGMAFAMSSTAIGLATLEERGLLATPGGQTSFAVLLFQDLAVIPLMLVLAAVAGGNAATASFGWRELTKAVVTIAVVVVAGRHLLRPLLRAIAATRLREIFVAFALLLVLGIAALMQFIGLSMALGAFLAGVLLADSEYRHELEIDIEPFKGLLMGLFFIAIGMGIDVALFVRQPLMVIGLALALVCLKAAIVYPIARIGGQRPADALLAALVLSQVGEFAYVLLGAASALPRHTVNLMSAIVATSMVTTPLLLIAYERVMARRIRHAASRAADAIEERHPVVLVGFGRYGQIVARVLRAVGREATIIDHDPNQIELVRRFGWKAYYGDASRIDVLEAAGIADACLLVVALDDPEISLALVKEVRARYPSLAIIARAHGRTDAYEYAELAVPAVREVFASALDATEAALRALGWNAHPAHRVVAQFRRHDEEMLRIAAEHRHDVKRLIALTRQGRDDLERLLAQESHRTRADRDVDWR